MESPTPNSLWAPRFGGSVVRFVAPATYSQPELGSFTDLYVLAHLGESHYLAVDASAFHENYQPVK